MPHLVHHLLLKADVVPSKISFNATISACEKGRKWQLALHFLNEAM